MKLKYAVIYEEGQNDYAAYAPDVPGCGNVGKTLAEIRANIAEVLAHHIELLMEYGDPVTKPSMSLDEAMAHHKQVLAEYDDDIPESPATVGMVEILVEDAPGDSIKYRGNENMSGNSVHVRRCHHRLQRCKGKANTPYGYKLEQQDP